MHYIYKVLLAALSLLPLKGLAQQPLTILHTSDTHSCVEPISPNDINPDQANKAGYMRRAALIKQLRQQTPDLLLLDCGDFSQGSVYYSLFKGEVEVRLMNEMRYDACTIGNHEFDYGLENMARLFRMAQFPIVCCNYDFTSTPVDGLVQPFTIINRAGHRIGIVGVAPRLEGLVQQSASGATTYSDPATTVQPIVDRLRAQEQCDIIICLSHLGIDDDQKFIRATRGIDVVLGGHSHTYQDPALYVPNADGKLIPLDHQGKNGRFVGRITMEW